MNSEGLAPTDIQVSRKGSGPPLVLLHCLGVEHRLWDFAAAGLERDFTLISYDFPGHGGTPVAKHLLRADLWVADVVYRPLETELLRDARAAGCRTLDGGGMVVLQAAGSFERFTGAKPDRERMLRHFQTLGGA